MANMNISERLVAAEQFMRAIDNKMDGLSLDGEVRSRIFNGFLHLSLEHFGSIVLLMRSRMIASAAALLRPQYEAVMRGIYFYECATENEVESFLHGKEPEKLYKMVGCIEEQFSIEKNPLTNIYSVLKKEMHSFTHGGFEQIHRRYTDTELVSNYSEDEKTRLITVSHILAIFAATFTAGVARRDDLAVDFVAEVKKLAITNQSSRSATPPADF